MTTIYTKSTSNQCENKANDCSLDKYYVLKVVPENLLIKRSVTYKKLNNTIMSALPPPMGGKVGNTFMTNSKLAPMPNDSESHVHVRRNS